MLSFDSANTVKVGSAGATVTLVGSPVPDCSEGMLWLASSTHLSVSAASSGTFWSVHCYRKDSCYDSEWV